MDWIGIQTILDSEFHSYSHLQKSNGRNIDKVFGKGVTFSKTILLIWCIHLVSLVWIPALESLFHALFKNKSCCRDKQILIFTPTLLPNKLKFSLVSCISYLPSTWSPSQRTLPLRMTRAQKKRKCMRISTSTSLKGVTHGCIKSWQRSQQVSSCDSLQLLFLWWICAWKFATKCN